MRSMDIDMYLFSATGNTLLVTRRMCQVFERRGCRVRIRRMETWDPATIDLGHTLGLAFPVAAQTTYPLVWEFCQSLREAQGTEAFMVDTMAGFSGGVVGPLRKVMEDRGYAPIGAREIIMPLNLGRAKVDADHDERSRQRGLRKAEAYANDLLDGRTTWGRIPILPDLMRAVGGGAATWRVGRWLGSKMHVDPAKCTRCGLCAEYCPVQNIVMEEYPRHLDHCTQCMRCFGLCPTAAVEFPWVHIARYRAMAYADLRDLDTS